MNFEALKKMEQINSKRAQQITGNSEEMEEMNKTIGDKGDISADNREIQRIIDKTFTILSSYELEHFKEMNKFLDVCGLSKLRQGDLNKFKQTYINDIQAII